ncbi:uncharacterized protein PFL1_06594 [Pseudozyma flocculosa PF-1]|uniref:Uncharacterized protein n=1 Tax=Pseudozyma flocculosa PF-1 TaxID=1277687 RepID=A0A061H2A5_9BASI|nr:uncharacterized protein PFL1_06594 [Pseudozyma flocculosa PF-1]EPQ25920.1 hypothetical protein PFL1_06594 [Pseudozyma flocculosa PF-1]
MPPVKSEPGAAGGVKSEHSNGVASGSHRNRNGTSNAVAAAATATARKQEAKRDLPPPPPTTYRDIPLFSTDAGPWLTHLMKFAHHTRVDPADTSQFVPPLKLNRKNPPRPKLPRPKPGDPVTDKYGRPMLAKDGQPLTWPAPGEDLARIEEVIRKEDKPKAPGADQSLIAPGSAARPPKGKLFQKKVKEVHKAADSTRRTMKQEYFPWVLEDFETSEEWESTRNPVPTGAKALEGWIDELKAKGQLQQPGSSEARDGDVSMASAGPSSAVKDEGEAAKASAAGPSSSSASASSHAPWIGKLEGDSDENATSHHVLFVFDERDAGGFKVVPVTRMYKFLQKPKHSTMSNEEVEAEYQKYQKTKEMDRWAMRKARGDGGPTSASAVKSEGGGSGGGWGDWPGVGRLALPSGGSSSGGGRRRNLMAVHGGALLNDDDDEGGGSRRRKREDDGGTYGELDYEEEFADDEEKMDEGDPYAEDEETRELEERLKREMARANKIGDDAADSDVEGEGSAAEDDNKMLTGSGEQMRKLVRALARKDGNEVYDRDEEERNPYASDDSDDDDDETYVANPEKALQIAREEREKREREAAKNNKLAKSGTATATPGTPSGSQTPTGRAEKRPQAAAGPRVPANAVEAEIIQLVREGKIANTSELVHHFRKRLKTEPQIKELLSAAVRKVAVMDKATNKLKLKDGF